VDAANFLTSKEFIGTILTDKDTLHQGKYKVNVPGLQPHTKETDGIWCKNHVCRHRVSPSQVGVSGSYIPLQAGMSVIVKFFANHIESGYIDRVISDAYSETLPLEIIERDEYYQIIRTPKHNHLIAIYDGDAASKNVPKNSIHIYFNNSATVVVIDESGINIKTAANVNITVAGNSKITTTGTTDLKSTGNVNIESAANVNIKAGGDVNIEAGGSMNLKSSGAMNLQGAPINQNGTAAAAGPAAQADAPSTITISDYTYFTKSSGK